MTLIAIAVVFPIVFSMLGELLVACRTTYTRNGL